MTKTHGRGSEDGSEETFAEGGRVWDRGLLEELARASLVDEKTIRRNVVHLLQGLGVSLVVALEQAGPSSAGRKGGRDVLK